jgi:tetratricopeptide (TPR) repeat protein
MTGGWSCEQYFDFDYSQIAAVPTTNLDPHQMDDAIEQQPDNGSLYFMRAWLWIVAGDNYAQARADLEQSLALDSSAGLPELLSILLAHREGRIDDAQGYMQAALTNISDPTLIQNDAEALFGGSMTNHFEKVFPIMARFGLGQYEDAYSDMEALLEPVLALSMPERDTMFQELDPASQHLLADQLAWRGLTACATGNYADAEESYTWALELNPDFALLYTLRAQARAAQGNAEGEAEDYRNAQERSPGPAFDPWIPAAQSGAWTCTNLFDYSLEAESS